SFAHLLNWWRSRRHRDRKNLLQCECRLLAQSGGSLRRSNSVAFGPKRTLIELLTESGFMSTRPSVMGPVMSSLPQCRHAAELTLLSLVDPEAATLCCQRER